MKLKVAIIAVLTTFSTASFSQNHLFGLRAGAGYNTILNLVSDRSPRIGLVSGFTYEYQSNNRFNFGIDLLYAQKGSRSEIIFTDQTGSALSAQKIKLDFDYLSLPIKSGISFGDNKRGFVNLGIVPSFLINAKSKLSEPEESATIVINLEPTDLSGTTSAIDLSALIEIGTNLQFSENMLFSGFIAYQHSMTDLSNITFITINAPKHFGFSANLGLKYVLK